MLACIQQETSLLTEEHSSGEARSKWGCGTEQAWANVSESLPGPLGTSVLNLYRDACKWLLPEPLYSLCPFGGWCPLQFPLFIMRTVLFNWVDHYCRWVPHKAIQGCVKVSIPLRKETWCSSVFLEENLCGSGQDWLISELPLVSSNPEWKDRDVRPSPVYHSPWELCGQLPLCQAKFRRMKRSTK